MLIVERKKEREGGGSKGRAHETLNCISRPFLLSRPDLCLSKSLPLPTYPLL